MSRIAALESILGQDPNNSRIRYMLAIETAQSGELEAAAAQFRELLARDPAYSAAYYHGGQTLVKLGRIEEAKELYRQGIEAATAGGDTHTRSEIQAALDLL